MSKQYGWIALSREITSHWIWSCEPYSKAQAWVDLLLHANHTDTKIIIKGTLVPLKRGQQARSQVTLAEQWKWSRDKVKRFLKMLEKDEMIIQQTSQLTSIITICNYKEFQDIKDWTSQQISQQTSQRADSRQVSGQVTVNNDNNEEPCKQKKPISENKFSDDDLKLAEFIWQRILKLNPNAKKPDLNKWAETIRITREQDKRTHKELQDVFLWANCDSFWQKNILSPKKLREQFDSLVIKMKPSQQTESFSDIDYGEMEGSL